MQYSDEMKKKIIKLLPGDERVVRELEDGSIYVVNYIKEKLDSLGSFEVSPEVIVQAYEEKNFDLLKSSYEKAKVISELKSIHREWRSFVLDNYFKDSGKEEM